MGACSRFGAILCLAAEALVSLCFFDGSPKFAPLYLYVPIACAFALLIPLHKNEKWNATIKYNVFVKPNILKESNVLYQLEH